jgi:hypothetical protein
VLCLEEFTNNIQQVCWVLTFMKKDCGNFCWPHDLEWTLDWPPLFPDLGVILHNLHLAILPCQQIHDGVDETRDGGVPSK